MLTIVGDLGWCFLKPRAHKIVEFVLCLRFYIMDDLTNVD